MAVIMNRVMPGALHFTRNRGTVEMEIVKGLLTLRMNKDCSAYEGVALFPSTVYFEDKDGKEYPVDFNNVAAVVDKENPYLIHFEGEEPDTDSFPALQGITEHFGDITKIHECYASTYSDDTLKIMAMESLSLIVTGMGEMPDAPYFTFKRMPDGDMTQCIANKKLVASSAFIYEE